MSTPPPSEGLSPAAVALIFETRILVDAVEFFRPGEPVLDPDSGEYHPSPDQIFYTGPTRRPSSGRTSGSRARNIAGTLHGTVLKAFTVRAR
ncbi:hypothetical protein [Streptomyces sp. NPDC055681]